MTPEQVADRLAEPVAKREGTGGEGSQLMSQSLR